MKTRFHQARPIGRAAGAPRQCACAVALVLLSMSLAACEEAEIAQEFRVVNGDPQSGVDLIRQYGCPSCHTIPGISGADGIVGPPLDLFARRVYIAGVFPNTPDNLVRWIMEPPDMVPETAMPDMNIPEDQARHIAAYLYTLR